MRRSLASLFGRSDPSADLWAGAGGDVLLLHASDGRVLRASDSAASLLGRPPSALVGKRLSDLVEPGDHPRLLRALAEAARDGEARLACAAARPNGPRPVELSICRAGAGLRTIMRDGRARAARDAALRAESLDAAWFAEKRTEHLVNVSHEIRTPLGAVIGFADALRRESFGPVGHEKYRDYARVIHDSGQHLLGLVSDLLDLSKAEANEVRIDPRPTDLPALLATCADIVRLQAEGAGLTVTTALPDGLPPVLLDAKIVRQVVLNLLSNALKFTKEGGVTIGLQQRGETLAIEVRDTGVGMSAGDLALVGYRFKQARSEGVRGARGTGIGLQLSHALARVHGGELRLSSAEGEGTTALLTLPFEPAPAEDYGTVVTLPPRAAPRPA
jgi:cell cycle sensor histidine kinase DivJ